MSDVTQRKTAAGDAAAQQAQAGRVARREAAVKVRLTGSGTAITLDADTAREMITRGVVHEATVVDKGRAQGLKGYSEHDYADEDGQRQ